MGVSAQAGCAAFAYVVSRRVSLCFVVSRCHAGAVLPALRADHRVLLAGVTPGSVGDFKILEQPPGQARLDRIERRPVTLGVLAPDLDGPVEGGSEVRE